MDWTLFYMSSALWIFFTEHFLWQKRFEAMAEHGMQVPAIISSVSKALTMITMLNLVVFLFVYGFKVSWLWSLAIVIGGYVAALAYVFLTRRVPGTLVHKVGWIGMPVLSIAIWVYALVI